MAKPKNDLRAKILAACQDGALHDTRELARRLHVPVKLVRATVRNMHNVTTHTRGIVHQGDYYAVRFVERRPKSGLVAKATVDDSLRPLIDQLRTLRTSHVATFVMSEVVRLALELEQRLDALTRTDC